MLPPQQLAHAQALSRHGSFRRAADAIHLSQPALSRSIARLEDALGVVLFDREGPAVTPTLCGEALLRHATTMLAEIDELKREIAVLKGREAGACSIAMEFDAAGHCGRRALAELIRRRPNLSCQVRHGDRPAVVESVLARGADLGFMEIGTLTIDGRLRVAPVGRHETLLYCRRGHPLLKLGQVSERDLKAYPMVSMQTPSRTDAVASVRRGPAAGTADPGMTLCIDDPATVQAIVLASDAVSRSTPVQIESGVRGGELCVLPVRVPHATVNYGFISLENRRLSPAAELFVSIVRKIEAELRVRNRALMAELLAQSSHSDELERAVCYAKVRHGGGLSLDRRAAAG